MSSGGVIKLNLTDYDRQAIAEALDDPELRERFQRRLLTIRMHDLGVPQATIAATLNLSPDTVTNYLKRYLEGSIQSLLEDRYYRPVSSVEPFLQQIIEDFTKQPVATCSEAASRIEKITAIKLSDAQTGRLMRRLGMKYQKSAAQPGGGDPQLQFDFWQRQLLPRLEAAQQGKRRVFFVAAAHFVPGAFLGMIWAFSRVFVRSGSGRQRYSVLGAVETRDHDFISVRTTGSVNTETVAELIMKIDRAYPGEEITLVMDNARYQHNPPVLELAQSVGVELLYLPAYSPNLNLIERVWRLVKSRCLRNQYYETFRLLVGAIDDFIDSLSGENRQSLKTLVTENFQLFEIPKT